MRANKRSFDELRPIKIKLDYLDFADGSAFIEIGKTRIVAAATIEEKVPPFLKKSGTGWITAEYSMLPRSTEKRNKIGRAHIEIHLTQIKDGMMRMIKQDNLNIKANGYVELKPNALHMMLIGKLKPIKSGSIIPLTLSFDNGETINIDLKVKSENRPQMKCGAGKCGSM